MKVNEFFKKYVSIANILKIWNADITITEVNEVFANLDKDGNEKLQVKDLILAIIEKIMKK